MAEADVSGRYLSRTTTTLEHTSRTCRLTRAESHVPQRPAGIRDPRRRGCSRAANTGPDDRPARQCPAGLIRTHASPGGWSCPRIPRRRQDESRRELHEIIACRGDLALMPHAQPSSAENALLFLRKNLGRDEVALRESSGAVRESLGSFVKSGHSVRFHLPTRSFAGGLLPMLAHECRDVGPELLPGFLFVGGEPAQR